MTPQYYAKTIKENIVKIKRQRGLSHANVAAGLRMSDKQYYRRLSGEVRWHADEIFDIARVLSCSPNNILTAVLLPED